MNAGAALNEMLGPALTVTVAWLVSVPPGPIAVSVYVVVTVGCTEVEPESGCDPTPLSMVTVVAFVVVQTSDELCPEAIVLGVAENEIVGGGKFTVTVAVLIAVPPGPVAVRV